MSSFKRKSTSKQPSLPLGTRVSPSSLATTITSTGIPSLDDILGGGLPLSCSLLILAPDSHSAYGELVQKYFVAQGLACGQRVCLIDDDAMEFVCESMWTPSGSNQASVKSSVVEDEEDEKADQHDDKIKIAWRYEQMKQFQTTVPSSTSYVSSLDAFRTEVSQWFLHLLHSSAEEYCRTFDLTCRIPSSIVEDALRSGDLICLGVDSAESELPTTRIIRQVEEILKTQGEGTSKPLRICIPSLGSPQWRDIHSQEILRFLYSLRRLLRQHPHACAALSLSPNLCTDTWGGSGWIQKLGWLSDAAITLSAFTANPSLAAIFPTHHGLLHIHTLPAPHTILSPSDKFSTLRGLSSSTVSTGGSGENNLAFKCMRKRLIFETLHLDVEGGVGERRTTPAANVLALDAGMISHDHDHDHDGMPHQRRKADEAAIQVEVEAQVKGDTDADNASVQTSANITPKKPKKKVAFHSDRPDLYDF